MNDKLRAVIVERSLGDIPSEFLLEALGELFCTDHYGRAATWVAEWGPSFGTYSGDAPDEAYGAAPKCDVCVRAMSWSLERPIFVFTNPRTLVTYSLDKAKKRIR